MKNIALLFALMVCSLTSWAQPFPDTLWTRSFGGTGIQKLVRVIENQHHELIGVGYRESLTSALDFWILALDSAGALLWEMQLPIVGDQIATDIKELRSGGYAVAGSSSSPPGTLVVRLSAQGDTMWTHTYETHFDLTNVGIAVTYDGEFVVATHVSPISNWPRNAFRLGIDAASGDSLWGYPAPMEEGEESEYALCAVRGLRIYLVGWKSRTQQIGEPPQFIRESWLLITELDENGMFLRHYTRGYHNNVTMRCKSVKFSLLNMPWLLYQIADQWNNTGGLHGAWGPWRYERLSFGRPISDFVPLQDGGFLGLDDTTRQADRDFRLLRFDSTGHELWSLTFGGAHDQIAEEILQLTNGDVLLTGTTETQDSLDLDAIVMRIAPDIISATDERPLLPQELRLSLFPNPFNPSTTISFSIPKSEHVRLIAFDLAGREVATMVDERMDAGDHTRVFDGANLPSGIYFAKLTTGTQTITQKMLFVK